MSISKKIKSKQGKGSGAEIKRPVHSWLKRLGLFLICLIILGFISWKFLTSNYFLSPRIAGLLSEYSGGNAQLGYVQYSGDGIFVLSDVQITIDGLTGETSKLLNIPRLDIDLDLRGIFHGEVKVESLHLYKPVLRLSEDMDSGLYNIGGLFSKPPQGPAGSVAAPIEIPPVYVHDMKVEIGNHNSINGTYHTNGTIFFEGKLLPSTASGDLWADKNWYNIQLTEIRKDTIEKPVNLDDETAADPVKDDNDSSSSSETAAGLLNVTGKFNVSSGEISLIVAGLDFDSTRSVLLPIKARAWWQTVQPRGQFEPVLVDIKPGGDYRINIIMNGIDWSIPLGNTYDSSKWIPIPFLLEDTNHVGDLSIPLLLPYKQSPVRMTDVRGTITLYKQGAELLGLSGMIDDVGYSLSGEFYSFGKDPSFDLSFKVYEFDLRRNLTILEILPPDYRNWVDTQLEEVKDLNGSINVEVELKLGNTPVRLAGDNRDFDNNHPDDDLAAITDIGGQYEQPVSDPNKLRIDGKVHVLTASGTFEAFPYPLSGINGNILFDNDKLEFEYLVAHGPDMESVNITGKVMPPGPDAAVDLDIAAYNVPLTEHLIYALGEHNRKPLDLYFHKPSAASLHDAGLYITPEEVNTISEELLSLLSTSNSVPPADEENTADDTDTDSTKERIRYLQKQLEKPIFSLGGKANITSRLLREPGPDKPTKVTNHITLTRKGTPIGVIYKKFPYPIYVIGGELTISYDKIEFVKDLILVGPTGASAMLSGYIDRVRVPERRMEPHLRLTANKVPIDPILLHAIPGNDQQYGNDGWPGAYLTTGAEILTGFNLAGDLIGDGRIYYSESIDDTDFDFDIQLVNGVTDTDNFNITNYLGNNNWRWPDDYPITNINSSAKLTRNRLTINEFRGEHSDESLQFKGIVDWSVPDAKTAIDLSITGNSIRFDDHLIDMVTGFAQQEHIDRLRKFWEEYKPQGIFDIELKYQKNHQGNSSQDIILYPLDMELAFGDKQLDLEVSSGSIAVVTDQLGFNDLNAYLRCDDVPTGYLRINGDYGFAADHDTTVTGYLLEGRFESPLIEILLDKFSDTSYTGILNHMNSIGVYDAVYELTFAPDEHTTYNIIMNPYMWDFTWKNQRFETTNLQGQILFTPGNIDFFEFSGLTQDGSFDLDGKITIQDNNLTQDLNFDALINNFNDRVRSLIPDAANNVINSLNYQSGRFTHLRNTRLFGQATVMPMPDQTLELKYDTLVFNSDIDFADAAVDISIPITEINGTSSIHISRTGSTAYTFCEADMDLNNFRVSDRFMTDGNMHIITDERNGDVLIPRFVADCYGGQVAAHSKLVLPAEDHPGNYSTGITLADVEIDPLVHPLNYDYSLDKLGISTTNATEKSVRKNTGLTFARLDLAGNIDDPDTRLGTGAVRVYEAKLYNVPFAMLALQLSSLSWPVSSSFNYADINFSVDGDDILIERLYMESPSICLNGEGILSYSTRQLDLYLNTISMMRTPILTQLWETLRDSILSIHVTGTLDNPKPVITALSPNKSSLHTIQAKALNKQRQTQNNK